MSFRVRWETLHLGSDEDEQVDSDIEQKILAINFDEKLYRELEELQFEGKNDEIWKVVCYYLCIVFYLF